MQRCADNSVGNRLEFHTRSSVLIGKHLPINIRLYNQLGLVIKDYISFNVTIYVTYMYMAYIYVYVYVYIYILIYI